MKLYKVVFKGRKKGNEVYRNMTIEIRLENPILQGTGVLPELNKNYDVWELIEIWEKIY